MTGSYLQPCRVYMGIKGIQGIPGYTGYARYTGNTWVHKVYSITYI